MDEVIAAIASPLGVGAISLIRVSGRDSISIVGQCFSQIEKLSSAPRLATLGTIRDSNDEQIDEVLATFFPGPASFTGEDVVEIAGHGGVFVTQKVLSRLIECGARAAEGGEFSQRAFFNGKLDLTQAEGIMDVISAQSDLALKAAQNQMQGSIQKATGFLRGKLIEVTAHLEAYIDFPEDDIDPDTGDGMVKLLFEMVEHCQSLLSTSSTGRLLREGARVVICGEPNAGKSSLLNQLLGYDRALVSDIKGTTRDTVEEVVNIQGLPIRFIDTAGLRETDETIEKAGIDRAWQEMESADLILEIIDGTKSHTEVSRPDLPSNVRDLLVLNKSDLDLATDWGSEAIPVSCVNNSGIDILRQKIGESLLDGSMLSSSSLIAINGRHQGCLRTIVESLEKSISEIKRSEDPELIALTMRESLQAVGEITGRIDTEEILGEIFAQFCIGK